MMTYFIQNDVRCHFLPVDGEHEMRLFCRLILEMQGKFFEYKMAQEWCKYVDGINIFPKLPVYLRNYYKTWERNRRKKDAVEGAKDGVTKLNELNAALVPVPASNNTNNTAILEHAYD